MQPCSLRQAWIQITRNVKELLCPSSNLHPCLTTADYRLKHLKLFGATKMHASKIATTSRQNNVTKIATKIKPWKHAQTGFFNSVSTLKGFKGLNHVSHYGSRHFFPINFCVNGSGYMSVWISTAQACTKSAA